MNRQGIVLAGNLIVDHIKPCDRYPQEEHLALLGSAIKSNGGAPLNVAFDLRALGYHHPVAIMGAVGGDESAKYLRLQCADRNIESIFTTIENTATSYTDVFVSAATGKRTFFHDPGANALYYQTHLPSAYHSYQHLHYGYLNLLASMDMVENGHSGASKLLQTAQSAGLTTSVDLVSSQSQTYAQSVKAVLPFTDILFCNEVEALQLTGLSIEKPDYLSAQALYTNLTKMGFSGTLVLHTQTWSLAIRETQYVLQPSLQVDASLIKSNSGAGDAFAAGFLMHALQAESLQNALLKATYSAATCLLAITCSDGIQPYAQALQTFSNTPFYNV